MSGVALVSQAAENEAELASAVEQRSLDGQLTTLRWIVVLAQGTTIMLTLPLWKVRTSPPNLPLVDWLSGGDWPIDFHWILLGSLVVALTRPAIGAALHLVLLVLSILADQLRMQPECISLALLLIGTTWGSAGKIIARSHLIALWFFAGLHKLLSPDYLESSGPDNFLRAMPTLSISMASYLAVALAIWELLQGVLLLIYPWRRIAGFSALILHTLILCGLVASNLNTAVWPWNVALAAAGLLLIPQPIEVTSQQRWHVLAYLVGLVLLLSPPLYYVGKLDAYLAHCLYSDNTPQAAYYDRTGESRYLSSVTMDAMNVPFPPAHRLFFQYFDRVSQAGDSLVITDERSWAKAHRLDKLELKADWLRPQPQAASQLEKQGLLPMSPLPLPGAIDGEESSLKPDDKE